MKGWSFYPLWGLEMAENGRGLDNPIFGDATIVAPGFLRKAIDERAAAVFAGSLRHLVEASDSTPPVEWLVDLPPHAFIAVRRSNAEDALLYAESIRALLSATFVMTSGTVKGFSTSPLALFWGARPAQVQLNKEDKIEASFKVFVNNFMNNRPVPVSHRLMRESWDTGSAIRGTWRVHKDHALSKVLVGSWGSLSALGRRVRSAAAILARAMESLDPAQSTLLSVVAIETLLKVTGDSKEVEALASCIFEGPIGPSEIARLFANRNRVAHEGWVPEGGMSHSQEVAAVWGVLTLGAIAASTADTAELVERLQGRVRARQVGKVLRENGHTDLADQVERAVTFLPKDPTKRQS